MSNAHTAPRTGYRISRDARTMAAYHGLRTSDLVGIARDLNLNVYLQETPGGRHRTRWTIGEKREVLEILADHLENHLEDMSA